MDRHGLLLVDLLPDPERQAPCPMLIHVAGVRADSDSYWTASMPTPSRVRASHFTGIERVFLLRKRTGSAFTERVGVGSAPTVDVHVPLPGISKHHAFLTVNGTGDYTLTDTGSKNGTLVDGVIVGRWESEPLEEGAEIWLGPAGFVFHTPGGLARAFGTSRR